MGFPVSVVVAETVKQTVKTPYETERRHIVYQRDRGKWYNTFFRLITTTQTLLLDGALTVTLIPTLRPRSTLALLRERLYRTSEAPLRLSAHEYYNDYNIRVAHKPITTLRRLLTKVKDKDKPEDRQGAVYKIK